MDKCDCEKIKLKVDNYVKSKPYHSMAIAAGTGYLLGLGIGLLVKYNKR